MIKSLESIATRGISIILKFLLLTFLAKSLSLSDYGFYQLIAYFTIIAITIYGLEYYMYGNREVAKDIDLEHQINNHLSFFFTLLPFTVLLQIIAVYILIPHEILSIKLVLILLFSNFCDYFNQEVYRYLVVLKKIRRANIMLIAKSFLFLFFLFLYYKFYKSLDLDKTITIMFLSYVILVIVTSIYFFKNIIAWKAINIKILSLNTLTKTFHVLFPFLLMMLFTKGLEFFDKFAIEYFYGPKSVGIYSFLFSIAYLTYVFVVTGFYMIYLPEFIKMNEQNDSKLKEKLIKFSMLIIGSSILMCLGIIFFIDILLDIIGKSDITSNIQILYILLAAFFFLNLSLIPGIILYINAKDKSLMLISGLIFVINIILNVLFLNKFGIIGAAIALLITYLINFIIMSLKANIEWKEMKKSFL